MRQLARLRQVNAIVSATMLVLFLLHAVGNSFELVGWGLPTSKVVARAALALAVVHAAIGVVLTVADLRRARGNAPQGRPGLVAYAKKNARYIAVRVSGLALIVLIGFHMATFLQTSGDGAYRLREFGMPQLVESMLLVAALAIHVLANARPLMVSLGVPLPRARAFDMALVIGALLVLMGAAFAAYFLRWSVV